MGLVTVAPTILTTVNPWGFAGSTTINAVGESRFGIGRLRLQPGASGSKTISAAGGGKIYCAVGTSTFANPGSTLRWGLQDVDPTTGFEDGTFDVYASLVGGTDPLAASTLYAKAMTTGSKTMAEGDIFAFGMEMTARGGADSVIANAAVFPSNNSSNVFPYGTADTGAGPLKQSNGCIVCLIEFDDGTVGWIDGLPLTDRCTNGMVAGGANQAFNSGSTPDEYAAVLTAPFRTRIVAWAPHLASIATTDAFEGILYRDPFGSPSVIETVTPDMDITTAEASGAQAFVIKLATPYVWDAGVTLGFAVRPTTANDVTLNYHDYTSGLTKPKRTFLWGENNTILAARTNQSGAFSEVQTYYAPVITVWVDQFDDGRGVAEAAFVLGAM